MFCTYACLPRCVCVYVWTCFLPILSLTDGRHSAIKKLSTGDSRKEPEKKGGLKPPEHRIHLSQAHLLAGAVKRRR